MNKLQRKQVIGLRNSGIKVKIIADLLDVDPSLVSGYYSRNKPKFETPDKEHCAQCGKPLTFHHKFCSDECCRAWWKEHPDAKHMKMKAIYTFTCAYCGKTFTAYGNSKRKYCSHECYIKDRFYKEN